MDAILSELITYLIKYVVFALLAVAGLFAGGQIRKKKNAKLEAEAVSAEEEQN